MTAKSTSERQRDLRARRAMLGLSEVRGIYLAPDKHAEIKRLARKISKPKKDQNASTLRENRTV